MERDVVVVGSGGSGLIAALHAAVRGARVTVLERAPVFGGSTSMSGGAQWIPGNSVGKRTYGLQDSSTDAELYLNTLSQNLVPKTVRAFVREAPKYAEFLAANTSCEIEAMDSPDYYRGVPGSRGPGRAIIIGLYDTSRLGQFKDLLRLPPYPGSVYLRSSEQNENVVGRLDQAALAALANERREKGIAARGRALVGALMEACLKNGVQLVQGTRVTQLIQNDGRVTGVVATRDGNVETFDARQGVVLAAGGFEWNKLLWNSLVGAPLDGSKSPPFNEGDGLRMGMRAGARLGNLNQVWWALSTADQQVPGEIYDGQQRTRGSAGVRTLSLPGSMIVNRRGTRFMNEAMPYYDAGRPLAYFDPQRHEYPNYPAFSVMDRQTFEERPNTPGVDRNTFSWLHEAPTLRALAERIGVNPEGLADQVKEWNREAEQGVDRSFHRGEFEYDLTREPWPTLRADKRSGLKNPLLRPLGAGPYYAVQVKATCFGTKGGVVIDEEARVLGFDDEPIPGLFAAGNVTACVYGAASPGGGSTLGPAMTFGWVAGRSASA